MADLIEQLMALGFSEYEAKAYVALQRLHTATGYQLAKESGVPRSMIYQVLDKLIARGAVLTQSFGDLVRYAPDPPDLLLGRMRGDFEARVAGLQAGLASIAVPAMGAGQVWNVAGRNNILGRTREMIENAQHSVAASAGDDDELDELVPWLRRADARGIRPLVIAPGEYDAPGLRVLACAEGQHFRQAVGHGLTLTVDGREALLAEVDRSETAVWTTNGYAVAWVEWSLHRMAAEAAGSVQPVLAGSSQG